MKTVKQIHREEQMEAARQEFRAMWFEKVVPRLELFRVNPSEYGKYEDIAWLVFRNGRGNNVARFGH